MTHIEELKAAAALIREECLKHNMCSECPFKSIVCDRVFSYPGSWHVEMIGVEDDE